MRFVQSVTMATPRTEGHVKVQIYCEDMSDSIFFIMVLLHWQSKTLC